MEPSAHALRRQRRVLTRWLERGCTLEVLLASLAWFGCKQGPPNRNTSADAEPSAARNSDAPHVERDGMVLIKGGAFKMGSNDSVEAKPMHDVTVRDFWLDKAEVTVSAYAACVSAGKCEGGGTDANCNTGQSDRANHPINCVDWNQATAYCAWAGKRLPSEEEWEYAAAGGSAQRKYAWGDAVPASQLCAEDEGNNVGRRSGTCEVGAFPAGDSKDGVHDLTGNVWEWTSSNWSIGYGDKNKVDESARVYRGGGWDSDFASHRRTTFRAGNHPTFRLDFLGFRCAR